MSYITNVMRTLSIGILLFNFAGVLQSQSLFTNIIDSTGIDAQTTRGIALGDYNDDGLLDMYLCSNPGPSYLYRNDGHNHFTEMSAQTGVKIDVLTAAPTWVDFDNDGDLDLYVAAYSEPNQLFRNDGGHFTDISATAGVQVPGKISDQGVWADYDRDGWVDLFIVNFEPYEINVLFRNNGNGTFSNMTDKAGLYAPSKARGAMWGDYNNDDWPDLYVHGQFGAVLYTNNGNGTFRKTKITPALDGFVNGLACTWRDINGDGFLDLTVGEWYSSMRLLLNDKGSFIRNDKIFNPRVPNDNNAAIWADIDNDGYPDLYTKELYGKEFLFKNNHGQSLLDIAGEAGVNVNIGGGGVVCGDMDNDGDLDLIAAHYETHRLCFYKNSLEKFKPSNHWLKVALTGTLSNRSAIGAKVMLYADTLLQMQEKSCGESGYSQSTPLLHFGLRATTRIDSLVVRWPSGMVQKITDVAVDQVLRIKESAQGIIVEGLRSQQSGHSWFILQNYPNPFNPATTISYELPVGGTVSVKVFDVAGRLVKLLFNGDQLAGVYSVSWSGTDVQGRPVAAGIYFYRLEFTNDKGKLVETRKMSLLK